MNASLTETPPGRPGEVPLRRNKGFRMLWIGQLLSDTGSEVGMLAYPLLILALTHSAVLAGIVATAREVALICLQLPAGALSDRLDRRLTMIVCDVLRAVLLVALGVLIALQLASWPVVLVVSVVEGSASAIFNPAATAALPGIVATASSRRRGRRPRPGRGAPAWPGRPSAECCSGSAGPSRSWPTPCPTRPRSVR